MAKRKDPGDRIRKLGEREEQITVKLTQIEIEDQRHQVMMLLDDIDKIDQGLKAIKAEAKGRKDAILARIAEARRQESSGRRTDDVVVEEWLTQGNEVVRVRTDTGEQIGDPRTARAAELQEKLFTDDKDHGFPSSEEAFGTA